MKCKLILKTEVQSLDGGFIEQLNLITQSSIFI